jgi:hypothetical protein
LLNSEHVEGAPVHDSERKLEAGAADDHHQGGKRPGLNGDVVA